MREHEAGVSTSLDDSVPLGRVEWRIAIIWMYGMRACGFLRRRGYSSFSSLLLPDLQGEECGDRGGTGWNDRCGGSRGGRTDAVGDHAV